MGQSLGQQSLNGSVRCFLYEAFLEERDFSSATDVLRLAEKGITRYLGSQWARASQWEALGYWRDGGTIRANGHLTATWLGLVFCVWGPGHFRWFVGQWQCWFHHTVWLCNVSATLTAACSLAFFWLPTDIRRWGMLPCLWNLWWPLINCCLLWLKYWRMRFFFFFSLHFWINYLMFVGVPVLVCF